MGKSKILVIGATGFIGGFIARAGVALHHPVYILVRPSTVSSKADLIGSFTASGVTVLQGSLDDHDSLVAAIKQVDVVISTVAGAEISKQTNIIAAIKEAGTIKRFLPSEFGGDMYRTKGLEPAASVFAAKAKVRRAVEEAQIPYTFVVSNCFASYFAANLGQLGATSPPTDKALIYGTGNVKTSTALEDDIGVYTVKSVDDPRTLNKTLHIIPPANVLTQNELVALWEKKTGKTLEKETVSEEKLVKQIAETPFPDNILTAIWHVVLIEGALSNSDMGPDEVEATKLYPEVKYTTIDEYLTKFTT